MSFVTGSLLDTVTLGRRELKRLHYLALRGPVERRTDASSHAVRPMSASEVRTWAH